MACVIINLDQQAHLGAQMPVGDRPGIPNRQDLVSGLIR
jgi:hypothetical protein